MWSTRLASLISREKKGYKRKDKPKRKKKEKEKNPTSKKSGISKRAPEPWGSHPCNPFAAC